MNREGFWFVSDVLNHIYCPWITYNWYVLGMPQSKKQEALVKKTKKHPERGIGGIKNARVVGQKYVRSYTLMLAGICDYVVFIDNKPAPLELKDAWMPKGKPWKNHLIQLACYSIMLGEEMGCIVDTGYIHYLRDGLTQKIEIEDPVKDYIISVIRDMDSTIENEIVRGRPISWRCCVDCCYRKICAGYGGTP